MARSQACGESSNLEMSFMLTHEEASPDEGLMKGKSQSAPSETRSFARGGRKSRMCKLDPSIHFSSAYAMSDCEGSTLSLEAQTFLSPAASSSLSGVSLSPSLPNVSRVLMGGLIRGCAWNTSPGWCSRPHGSNQIPAPLQMAPLDDEKQRRNS